MMSMTDLVAIGVKTPMIDIRCLTCRIRVVVEYTRCRVKTKSKLTNLKINSRIEGYNGK